MKLAAGKGSRPMPWAGKASASSNSRSAMRGVAYALAGLAGVIAGRRAGGRLPGGREGIGGSGTAEGGAPDAAG